MDYITEKPTKPNPKLTANVFNNLIFWWLKDIFWNRKSQNISASDFYDALPDDLSNSLCKDLEVAWKEEIRDAEAKKNDPSLWKAVIKMFKVSYFKRSLLPLSYCMISIFQPLALKLFMSHFQPGSATTTLEAYFYASYIVVIMIVQAFMNHHANVIMRQVGMRVRIACSSLVFKKITRLSYLSTDQHTKGSIINLISNDVAKFDYFALELSYTIIAPLQLFITTYLMWQDVGAVSIIGVVLMMIQSIPLQGYSYILLKKFRPQLARRRDERISLITEVINGIRSIKMRAWENLFETLVYSARSREVKVLMKIAYINAAMLTMGLVVDRLSAFATISIFSLSNGVMTADQIVSITQLLITFLVTFVGHCTRCMQLGVDVNVSMKRIEKFLLLNEVTPYVKKIESQGSGVAITVENATVVCDANSKTKILQDINITLNPKMLYVITGLVGSGKSTLLKLILGEFPPISGEVCVRGKVSYASQEPWLFPASVRENIIFGDQYDEQKYRRVTEVCHLISDFSLLPYGDKTLVGDKGTTLSGGQCGRINLARAIYKDADIYLLDSPLSAVDVHVNKKIFDDCINGFLKHKTRVLVTHDSEHLQKADNIIVINNGIVDFQGHFSEFCKNNVHFSYLVSTDQQNQSLNVAGDDFIGDEYDDAVVIENKESLNTKEPQETEELLATGYVAKSVYWKYIRASGSLPVVFVIVLIFMMSEITVAIFDYWIIAWTEKGDMGIKNLSSSSTLSEDYKTVEHAYVKKSVLICGILIGTCVIVAIIGNFMFWKISLKASKNIHNKMFACVMRTPMKFFQMNTPGRILNRFSKDVGTSDEILINSTHKAVGGVVRILTIVVPLLVINWWNVFTILIMGYIFFKITKMYLFTIQAVNRLEGNAKSPVLSISSSTINGLLTIRFCNVKDSLCNIFDFQQDRHTAVVYLASCMCAANGLILQLIVSVCFAFAAYGCLLLKDKMFASETGYILSNIINMADILQFTVKEFADALAFMTNMERMVQFTKLDQENLIESEIQSKIPEQWPEKGELRFDHVYLRYSEDADPVLKDLCFTIEPKDKIGIVGRTGAGKSSLIGALFRLAKVDGSIFIDGIDTKSISLFDLRSKISIIPQEPFIFSGSLRSNLDPLHEFDDASIWSVIQEVQLNNLFSSLECLIDKDGNNISLGQRQLICLARAILQQNNILILDEATASIDSATDTLIQKTIKLKFKNCTVLTIAHRLHTIIDSDKILVIEEGKIVEYGNPHTLIKQAKGSFYNMIQEAGEAMSVHLSKIAEKGYNLQEQGEQGGGEGKQVEQLFLLRRKKMKMKYG